MARPLRIEYEGAFYHVTSRGNERRKVFYAKADYEKFISYLKAAQEKYGCLPHCYVLMTNHYHLLIETPHANMSRVMNYINTPDLYSAVIFKRHILKLFSKKEYRKNWASLIHKIYEADLRYMPKIHGKNEGDKFYSNAQIIRKIAKHLALWDLKARHPPMANATPQMGEAFMDYSDSQLPPSDDCLYIDEQYPENLLA